MTVAQIGPRPIDSELVERTAGAIVTVSRFLAELERQIDGQEPTIRVKSLACWVKELFQWALQASCDHEYDMRADLHLHFEAAEWLMDYIAAGSSDWSDPQGVLFGKALLAKAMIDAEPVAMTELLAMQELMTGFCNYLSYLGWSI